MYMVMGAGAYVGRIGGLAIALGVGAAVVTGQGVASADPSTQGSDSSSSGSGPSSSSDGTSSSPPKSAPDATKASSQAASGAAATDKGSQADSGTATSGVDVGSADDSDEGDPTATDDPPKGHSNPRRNPDRPNSARASSDSQRPAERRPATEKSVRTTDSAKQDTNPAVSNADEPSPVDAVPAVSLAVAPVRAVSHPIVAEADVVPKATPDPVDLAPAGLSNLVGSLVDSFTGDGPTAPADPPMVWTLLAATRRETFGTATALATTATPATNALVVPTPVVAIPQTAPLQALQYLPVIGPMFITPIVTLIHQIPLIGDVLHPYLGYPVQLGLAADTPVPRDVKVVSFDGTQIYVHFIPATGLQAGKTAPTILDGPGLGLPGSTSYLTEKDEFLPNDVIGVGALRDAGYNVVTWDPRGEWSSGGQLEVDSPDFEARDVSAIISWLATQPEVQLDDSTLLDPRIGMVGASYGGGIQLVTAAIDHRVDAIVPTIAWNSLNTSLYKNQSFKTGWGTLLVAALAGTGARPNPALYPAAIYGALTGLVTPDDQQLLADRGPGALVRDIVAPTLLIQGTVDTLFTLEEANRNALALLANPAGVDVKVIWFCGGHGSCVSTVNDGTLVQQRTMDWLNHYVKRQTAVDTGPQFEWVDQHGTQFSSDSYPVSQGPAVVASSPIGGVLPLVPIIGGSGPQLGVLGTGPIGALLGIPSGAAAANAINLKTTALTTTTYVVGAPELTFTYSGVGISRHVYAQLVDDTSGLVLGNLVTPVEVTLDGQSRQATVRMEQVAQTLKPGETLTLQIVASAVPYEAINSLGVLNVSNIHLLLPTADPGTITVGGMPVV